MEIPGYCVCIFNACRPKLPTILCSLGVFQRMTFTDTYKELVGVVLRDALTRCDTSNKDTMDLHIAIYRISQQFRAIDYHQVCHQYHPITLTSRANPPAEHPPPEKPRKTSSSCLPPSSNPHNEVSVLPACSETQPALPICCSQ